MKHLEPTNERDAKGRKLWKKWCKRCAVLTITRFEIAIRSPLCARCCKIKGKGFPPGTLVDPEDAYLMEYSWSLNNSGYIKGPGGELHRVVMKAKKGQEIHHKNANKLDCRKENLVFTTHSANIQAYWDRKKGKVRCRDIDFF